MVMGFIGPQTITFSGILCLIMLNTAGKSGKIVVKEVYYNPSLQYSLVSVAYLSRTGHVTTFRMIATLRWAQRGHSSSSKYVWCMVC